jgi:hypothetical protein
LMTFFITAQFRCCSIQVFACSTNYFLALGA